MNIFLRFHTQSSSSSMDINIAEGCGFMVIDRTHECICILLGLYVDECSEWYPDEDELLSLLLILPVFSGSNDLKILSLIFIAYTECML